MFLKRVIKVPVILYRGLFSRGIWAIVILLCCADIYFETVGVPGIVKNYILKRAGFESARAGNLCLGVFNGLVFRDFFYSDEEFGGRVCLNIPYAKTQLEFLPLLKGKMLVKTVSLRDCGIGVPLPGIDEPLNIENVALDMSHLYEKMLHIEAAAECNGVKLKWSCELTNADCMPELVRAYGSFLKQKGGNVAISEAGSAGGLQKQLESFLSSDFGYNDSFLEIKSEIDAADWQSMRSHGLFSFSDATVMNVQVPKLHGKFEYANGRIRFTDFLWQLGRSEYMRGAVAYDFRKGTVRGHIDANVYPHTIFELIGADSRLLHKYVLLGNPANLVIDMGETSFERKEVLCSLKCNVNEFKLAGIDVPSLSFEANCGNGKVDIENILLDFRYDDTERIQGSAQYDVKEKTLSFGLEGDIFVENKLEALGVVLPQWLKNMLYDRSSLKLTLGPSPLDIHDWHLHCLVRHPELHNEYMNLAGIEIPILFNSGRLEIKDGSFSFRNIKDLKGHFSAEMALLDCMKSGSYSVGYGLSLDGGTGNGGDANGDCLKADGLFRYDVNTEKLECSINGSSFIDRFYSQYIKETVAGLDYIFEPFRCGELPYLGSANFTQAADGGWCVNGNLIAQEGCRYGRLTAKRVSSDFSINAKGYEFTGLQGTLIGGEKLSMDIRVQNYPFVFELKDFHLTGDPLLAESFIYSDSAKKIYTEIWKDVKWGEDDFPQGDIPLLRYTSDDASINWEMEMNGSIQARNFTAYGEKIDTGLVKMELCLPESMELQKVEMTSSGTTVKGSCSFTFGNDPRCNFSVDELSGPLQIDDVIELLLPELNENKPSISISDDAFVKCIGSVNLERPYYLKLYGTFDAGAISLGEFKVESLKSTWDYNSGSIKLDISKARFMDGDISGACLYNTEFNNGEVVVHCEKNSLDKVVTSLKRLQKSVDKDEKSEAVAAGAKPQKKRVVPGYLFADCLLHFYCGWGGVPLQVNGTGHIAVKDTDVWTVPILRELGAVMGNGLGEIRAAETDIIFMQNHLLINNFRTDGSIVSLEGTGSYFWQENKLNCTVKSRFLKNFGIISWLFSPLTNNFQARFPAKNGAPEWEVRYFSLFYNEE